MKGNKKSIIKKVIALVLAAAILVGAVAGGIYWRKNSGGEVKVYAVENLGSMDYGEEGSTSTGNVTTDKMQNVYLSDTQTVTKICVKEGQKVKEGDTILEYDTTLTDLDLKKKELSIQKMEIEKADMEKQVRTRKRSEGGIDSRERPSAPPKENAQKPGIRAMSLSGPQIPADSVVSPTEPEEPVDPGEPEEPEEPEDEKTVKTYKVIDGKGSKKSPLFVILAADYSINTQMLDELLLKKGQNWLIFLTTEGDQTDGAVLSRTGLICKKESDGSYSFSFFDASAYPLPNTDDDPGEIPADPGFGGAGGSGSVEDTRLTAEEIAELKERIRDMDLELRMAEVELKQMKREKNNGQVVSTVDGTVSSVLDLDTAKQEGAPIVKIAGGGGYFIRCTVSELELDKISVGQAVTVNAMESGGTYTGEISEIGDTPTSSDMYYGYGGNSNVSYYPFVVSVGVDADMKEFEYVSVERSGSAVQEEMSNGFYLENMFVLSEGNKRFVYVRGEDNRLEKRQVTVGNIRWGSIKITSGLTMEDWIAFPYGKSVKDGASTTEAGLSELYGY